jgi:type I restriction enzyme S subunit
MKTKTIPSSWLTRDGLRLDCNPYMSGALEARIRLEELSCKKEYLADLTKGHNGGIYNGPQFVRNFVEDPAHGVPFLGTSSMLRVDLSNLPLLKKKDAQSSRLSHLRIEPGMTLISCSGTIGRMVYARPDMDGMWSNQDILKVVPDKDKIPPGFLYAFLSSKYGVPLVTSGTYGAIIQHIEPEHVAGLPVPRINHVEEIVSRLIEEAASLRASASRMLASAVDDLENLASVQPLKTASSPTPYSCVSVRSCTVQERFDAFFHSPYGNQVVERLRASSINTTTIGALASSIVEPNRFKRIRVDGSDFGIRFFGTSALMWSEPLEMYLLPRNQQGIGQYVVTDCTVLIPRSGQLSGIIGSAVLPYGDIIGSAVSEDAIRINCCDSTTAGFVFVALTSQYGLRQLKARAYGSSIPHLDVHQIGRVVVPNPGEAEQRRIGEQGSKVSQLRNAAVGKEREARRIIELAIEGES